jgi:two-component system, NtrC family, nitrogen regulation response regulator NtrX
MTRANLAKILIVDDESSIRRAFKSVLEQEPYEIDEAFDGIDCLEKLKQKSYNIIFMDIKMPRKDGVETLEEVTQLYPNIPVVMISGNSDIKVAVKCMRQGAADYMVKPFDINQLYNNIKNALNDSFVQQKSRKIRSSTPQVKLNKHIIGKSEKVQEMNRHIELAAKYDKTDVLILGPNGAGKELVAQGIHQQSSSRKGPFIEINCAAIPDTLIDSTLFGHMKNAFTDAKEDRKSKFEEAEGGTIFLDEIGDMPLLAQQRLLRVLETRSVIRVGGTNPIPFNVRIISATNKNLREEVEKGNFRLDLYSRLNQLVVEVPSLNDRVDDIPQLVEFFKQQFYEKYQDDPQKNFDESAITFLQSRKWEGNIRQLKHIVDRIIIYSDEVTTIHEAEAKKFLTMGS